VACIKINFRRRIGEISILLDGFITGMILQIAIGPVFFFIINITLQKTTMDGYFAVLAVTIADYIYITLAILGVGKLLEKAKIKKILGILSSVVLFIFGLFMIISAIQTSAYSTAADNVMNLNYWSSFVSAFFLTISSPLTIIFWTGLFAAKAIEKGFTKRQLLFFGSAAGCSTFIFLGISVTLFSFLRTSIPMSAIKILNIIVGVLLVTYGIIRFTRIFFDNNKRLFSEN
jgi:threonine/homoserine/homoserine lactone efflux protein